MSSNLQTLEYHPTIEVRVILRDGETWWVLADVCRVLGLDTSKLKQTADRLDEDGKGRYFIPTHGGPQESWVINESGLYSVVLRSNKPEAKAFKRWVTHEVLPSIRRTGAYSLGSADRSAFVLDISAMSAPCSAPAQLLLLRLLELDRVQGGTGTVQTSAPELLKATGYKSRHTIISARRELEAVGLIEYSQGTKASPSTYRLKSM